MAQPLFKLGQIVVTPGALSSLQRYFINPSNLIRKHQTGDWGDITDEDKEENELAIKEGLRIFSTYQIAKDTCICKRPMNRR